MRALGSWLLLWGCLQLQAWAGQLGDSLLQDCNETDIVLGVRREPQLDVCHLHLGTCLPSLVPVILGHVVFAASFKACGFTRLISGKMVEFFADLVYAPPPRLWEQPPVAASCHRISCMFKRPEAPTPPPASLVTGCLAGVGHLDFSMRLWPGSALPIAQDGAMLQAPDLANASTIFLGSELHMEFAVDGGSHQPLQLYVDKYVTSSSRDLEVALAPYSLIKHHGCLVDGKDAHSHFLPRKVPERLELSFQAFGFTDNPGDVYVHCQLLVWDPKVPPDATKKACSFHGDTNRWKLLDNASLSSVCNCCEVTCLAPQSPHRSALAASDQAPEQASRQVTEDAPTSSKLSQASDSRGLGGSLPSSLLPVAGTLLVEVVSVSALGMGFCISSRCCWHRAGSLAPPPVAGLGSRV